MTSPRITPDALYRLLPAIHRLRDADEGGPLAELVAVLSREGAVIEENIEQLFDNLFIETCADWAAPYVGGIIDYKPLHPVSGLAAGSRAEIANTIGYRRRKGTAAVLEQLARDVTGWPAQVMEFFQTTATCQHMNHIRPAHHFAAPLRDPLMLEPLGGAFDGVSHSVDVRSIQQRPGRESTGGRHNLPNIGLHLWRLMPLSHDASPTRQVDARRYLFDPLGAPRQLINRPVPEDGIASLAEPVNVPLDLSRRRFARDIAAYYGPELAIEIFVDDALVPATRIEACDLSDDAPGWNHSPHDPIPATDLAAIEGDDPLDPPANALVRVDPVLGRIAFPTPETGLVRASWASGFPGALGGGTYSRADYFDDIPTVPVRRFPDAGFASLQDAIDATQLDGGIVEITNNDVIALAAPLTIEAGADVVLRAADRVRPVIDAAGGIQISGSADARVTLNGLTITGGAVEITDTAGGDALNAVALQHVSLVPGLGLTETGAPASPGAVSLLVTTRGLELEIARSITGPIRMVDTVNADLRDSIVDAAESSSFDSETALAISGPGGTMGDPAGALTMQGVTVLGRVAARSFPLVSDSILFARAAAGDPPVRAMRRQEGCMRFSYIPSGSVTPRRYRCQPQLAIDQAIARHEAETGLPVTATERDQITGRITRWLRPSFTAQRASAPAYVQLRQAAPAEIRTGASDEGEMGAWHFLQQPQRERNLRIRLEEYLRFGLEAGLFYET